MCYGPKPSIVFADLARIEAVYIYNTQIVENVYHLSTGGDNTTARLIELKNAFLAWESANRKNISGIYCALTDIKIRGLWDLTAPYLEYPVSPQIAGEVGGAQLPANVTIAVRWNTGL